VASVQHTTLVANVVSTLTLSFVEPRGDVLSFATAPVARVEVMSLDGAAEIYFTTNGDAPTVDGANCHVLPAAISSVEVADETAGTTGTVKLISSGTPKVSARGITA
jgi:hypothetical protein